MILHTPSKILENHVTLELECIDRMYLNVYSPLLQTGSGIAYFFKTIREKLVPSSALMGQMTTVFRERINQFITEQALDVVRFKAGERKDDITQEKLLNHDGSEGLLYVGVAQERAKVFRTVSKLNPATGKTYPWLTPSSVMCNQYYFTL